MRAGLALTALVLVATSALVHGQSAAPAPTGAGVTIAILDTGIQSDHAEIAGRVSRESYATPQVPLLPLGDVLPEDPNGQGTAVASIAAGSGLGVAPAAMLIDMQVSAKYTGQPIVDPATEEAAIAALDGLLQTPGRAPVVLLSFAQDGVSVAGGRTLAAQARGLWNQGVLVIVPTGPGPNDLSAAPHVVTVAGVESCPSLQSASLKPDLAASSQNLEAAQAGTLVLAGGTTQVSGTAYAAAQVAGAAALLRQARPDVPVDALASFLRDAARDLGPAGPDACSGYGELDAEASLAWLAMWRDPQSTPVRRESPGLELGFLGCALAALVLVRRRV